MQVESNWRIVLTGLSYKSVINDKVQNFGLLVDK